MLPRMSHGSAGAGAGWEGQRKAGESGGGGQELQQSLCSRLAYSELGGGGMYWCDYRAFACPRMSLDVCVLAGASSCEWCLSATV